MVKIEKMPRTGVSLNGAADLLTRNEISGTSAIIADLPPNFKNSEKHFSAVFGPTNGSTITLQRFCGFPHKFISPDQPGAQEIRLATDFLRNRLKVPGCRRFGCTITVDG